jgi:serine/threonine protein kinase
MCFGSKCCEEASDSDEATLSEFVSSLNLIPFEQLQVQDKIGEGGYANIYKGTWLGITVAIKVFKKRPNKNAAVEFKQEIDILGKLRHPHVILYIGASVFQDRYCVVTEFA